MQGRNLRTTLRRRALRDPMGDFDALPAELRRWLAEARLAWSPRSARRIWERALARHGGDRLRALAALDRAEAGTLARDAARIWGRAHPAANGQPTR